MNRSNENFTPRAAGPVTSAAASIEAAEGECPLRRPVKQAADSLAESLAESPRVQAWVHEAYWLGMAGAIPLFRISSEVLGVWEWVPELLGRGKTSADPPGEQGREEAGTGPPTGPRAEPPALPSDAPRAPEYRRAA